MKKPHPTYLNEPMAQTIGILPAFCVPHPTVLVMKEKVFSFSGDDFS